MVGELAEVVKGFYTIKAESLRRNMTTIVVRAPNDKANNLIHSFYVA